MYANLLAKSWNRSDSAAPPIHARLLPHLRAAQAAAGAIYASVGRTVLTNLGLDPTVWGSRLRLTLCLAALLHDLGKANGYFQGMVRAKPNCPSTAQPMRHELISVLLILRNSGGLADWLRDQLREPAAEDATDALFCTVIGAVAGHHVKMDAEWTKCFPAKTNGGGGTGLALLLGHPDLHPLLGDRPTASDDTWSLLPSASSYPGKSSLDFRLRHADWLAFLKTHDDWRRLAGAVKALTVAADVAASAILPEGLSPRGWITETLSNQVSVAALQAVVEQRLKGRPLRPFQRAIADTRDRITLAEASCGSGKTVAAYLWAAHHAAARKLFFCYPTTGTATEGYLDYVHDSEVEAELIHSRAGVDLEGMTHCADEDRQEQALRIASLNTWRPQTVVCTVDTVLALPRNNRTGLYGAPAILAGAFVFDELHAYDDTLFASVVALIRAMPGAPFLLMSASLPAGRKAFLARHLGPIGQVQPPAELEAIPRYRLAYSPDIDHAFAAASEALRDGQRVLWVCNTVARAQAIYDRAIRAGLPVIAYHSRFKYQDRVHRHREVVRAFAAGGAHGCLAVTTQVAEMSLDLDAHLLISELAPIPALIQRLGRLNRRVSETCHGSPRDALLLEPENRYPYDQVELDRARSWLASLIGLNRPVSQRDLAAGFCALADAEPERLDLRCEWLDSGWCAEPGPIRDASVTVRLILAEDAEACIASRHELIKRTLTMPYHPRMGHWPQHHGVFIAPLDSLHYDAYRGAAWAN